MVVRGICVAALAAGFSAAGLGSPDARADPSGASRYGACMAAQKSGDLLLLFDESSSLQSTDPKGARVTAAQYLVHTLGKYADRVHADLTVAIAGFSDGYTVHQDWTGLTGASADAIANGLQPQASRNTGIDTDYWLAFDGARQTLSARGAGHNGADRCQAIAFFTDGKIDFTARALVKPYASTNLNDPDGVGATVKAATESICRPGGMADQLRSRNIVMLAVGLSGDGAPSDFETLSAIARGKGIAGMSCGKITSPTPGDFYPVSNIDDMLFAFDALNPDPGITQQGPVCRLKVCQDARHDFVLDRSIKSVSILGSGGIPGVVPYLISPSGQTVELPDKPGTNDTQIAGVPIEYQWQSDSAQSIIIHNAGGPEWAGKWAITYVDTTGDHPDAVSKVSIHITTDIYPALVDAPSLAWHSGAVLHGVKFGLADGRGAPLAPDALAGAATLSATLVPDGAAPIPLLVSAPKADIAKPVDADLGAVNPGHAVLRMELAITTAPATDPAGNQIAPGTPLSPQNVELPIQILPRIGLPVLGGRIDFGSVQAAAGATASLSVTGPGCVWIAGADAAKVSASPDGIGALQVTSPQNSANGCLKIAAGASASLPVSLRTDHNGRGGLSGTIAVHIAALDNPSDNQVVAVPFVASLTKPVNTTDFVLVLIAALLLGPGIPLALLYASKWLVGTIPPRPLLAERIQVSVDGDSVSRGQAAFVMADTDLVRPVPGLAKGARKLPVLGVTLSARIGRSPFGSGYVAVEADGLLSVGSQIPCSDRSGLHAVLPLAIHNAWVLLHDPRGPATAAEVLLLVGGRSDTAARERLYGDVARRLPELLEALRARAVQAGLASSHHPREHASPFGGETPGLSHFDPFTTDAAGVDQGTAVRPAALPHRDDMRPFDPFGEGA
jgi:hypothetical protein